MTEHLELVFTIGGTVRCVYGEAIDLAALGTPGITRGSHVEPTAGGTWTADLAPVGGPMLGPFATRTLALEAEAEWLGEHWLLPRA